MKKLVSLVSFFINAVQCGGKRTTLTNRKPTAKKASKLEAKRRPSQRRGDGFHWSNYLRVFGARPNNDSEPAPSTAL